MTASINGRMAGADEVVSQGDNSAERRGPQKNDYLCHTNTLPYGIPCLAVVNTRDNTNYFLSERRFLISRRWTASPAATHPNQIAAISEAATM